MPVFQRSAAVPDAAEASSSVDLDDSQRRVLALPDGRSAAVVGAPGSGKTTTIIELVRERVLERGYAPAEVLVLAATRVSATTLRDRIALRVGVPTNGPLARTVNSLAFQIARRSAPEGEETVLLTGGEQDQIIAELLQGHIEDGSGPEWPDPLGPELRRLRGFRTELRDVLARCVEYGITPDALDALGRAHDRAEWCAAAAFIREYETVKDAFRARSFDSAELVQEATAILASAAPGVAGERDLGPLAGLRLIVIDDAQELTRSALDLARAFAARGVAVVAVGDPDVSTGTFRGAQSDSLGRLAAHLGVDVDTLVLDTVHRHGAGIRERVAGLTARIGTRGVFAQRDAIALDEGGRIRSVIAASPAQQIEMIARMLRERHVFNGVPWSDMAVIVRSGSLIEPLSRGLAALEVPTSAANAGSALRDEGVVRAFVLALDVALGRAELDGAAAVELLRGPLGGLDTIALRRLRAALRRIELAGEGVRGADELLVEALSLPGGLDAIDNETARRARRLAESVRVASAEASAGASIEELLWGLWERSGLARTWGSLARESGIAADEANRHLDATVALFAAAQRFVERAPDAPPELFLDELVGRDVAEDTLAPRALAESVTVSTPTGAIGRQLGVVVVAGVQENVWPDMRVRGSLLGADDLVARALGEDPAGADARRGVLHDELRMFAQAISRAEREVIVTAVADEDQAPSAFFTLLPDPDPAPVERHPLSLRGTTSRLRRLLVSTNDPHAADEAAFELARLAREGVPGADPAEWYGLAEQSTDAPLNDPGLGDGPVRVSPSRMESFETCPLHWLVDSLGGGSRNTASSLGSIIHSVAETARDDDADLSAAGLLAGVEARWGELQFESEWQSGLERVRASELTRRLSAYLRDFRAAGGELLEAEGGFRLTVGDAILSGSIDRVELRGGEAFIVDLKTGKNEPTSDAAVADHAQLGAYQLAWADGAVGERPDVALGGARLVIVSDGTSKQDWRAPTQGPLNDAELAAFRARVEEDARGMGGTTFIARIGAHCVDPWSFGSCRIHVVGQVSA